MSLYGVTITLIDAALGLATRRSHRGVEHIPAEGPVIVVSNLSISDPLVLGCTLRRAGRRATFMAMAEAFRWPVVGAFLHRTGQIPVVRSSASAAEAMAPALRALASGRVVALYPEGRVTTEADYRPLMQARTGAVRLALTAGCPVVPVAQWGAHRLVDRAHQSRTGGGAGRPTVTVLVGAPITPEQLRAAAGPDGDDLRAATDLVMARIRGQLAEIASGDLPDLLPGG